MTRPTDDLNWLLDDLSHRVQDVRHALVLSNDGLLMAMSKELSRDDAEHLSAVASGIQSLAKGAGERFGAGPVRQSVIEMQSAYLFVTVAGEGACLAVMGAQDCDAGVIAYEMAMLVARVGDALSSPARSAAHPGAEA